MEWSRKQIIAFRRNWYWFDFGRKSVRAAQTLKLTSLDWIWNLRSFTSLHRLASDFPPNCRFVLSSLSCFSVQLKYFSSLHNHFLERGRRKEEGDCVVLCVGCHFQSNFLRQETKLGTGKKEKKMLYDEFQCHWITKFILLGVIAIIDKFSCLFLCFSSWLFSFVIKNSLFKNLMVSLSLKYIIIRLRLINMEGLSTSFVFAYDFFFLLSKKWFSH